MSKKQYGPNQPSSLFPTLLSLGFLVLLATILAVGPASGKPMTGSRIHRDDGSMYRESLKSFKGAGDYHNGDLLVCSDCHVMHASLQHNYQGTTAGEGNIPGFPWSTAPNAKLLKFADPLDLCISCHDGVANIPDVINADVNGLMERSAGFFDEPELTSSHGHNLGRGLSGPQGSGICMRCHWDFNPDEMRVTCIDCHSPHGNGNPRNLQWPSDPAATPPLALFSAAGATGLAKYERTNVSYGTDDAVTAREVTSICIDCHHAFSGQNYIDPDGNGIHQKHPAYDSERNSPNSIDQGLVRGTTNPTHWNDGTGQGFDGTQRVPFVTSGAADYTSAHAVDAAANGVFCLSCHKPHGSDNAFGLVWTLSGGTSNLGCDQCHLGEGR